MSCTYIYDEVGRVDFVSATAIGHCSRFFRFARGTGDAAAYFLRGVLPSVSVKRQVTVPLGRSGIVYLLAFRFLAIWRRIV